MTLEALGAWTCGWTCGESEWWNVWMARVDATCAWTFGETCGWDVTATIRFFPVICNNAVLGWAWTRQCVLPTRSSRVKTQTTPSTKPPSAAPETTRTVWECFWSEPQLLVQSRFARLRRHSDSSSHILIKPHCLRIVYMFGVVHVPVRVLEWCITLNTASDDPTAVREKQCVHVTSDM